MSVEHLTELNEALEEGDDGEILDAYLTLEESVTADRRAERRITQLAIAIRFVTDPENEAFERGAEYVTAVEELHEVRERMLQATFEYFAVDRPASEVRDLIAETEARYEEVDRRQDSLETVRDEVTTPPVLAFEPIEDRLFPLGSESTVELDLANLGSRAATDIGIEAPGPIESSIEPETVKELRSDESVAIQVTLVPGDTDPGEIRIEAASDRSGDDVSIEVTVLDKAGFISRATENVHGMIDLLRPESPEQGSGHQGGTSVRRQLTRVEKRLESASEAIEREKPDESVDRKLDAAANQLEAVENRLKNDAGTGLDPSTTTELRRTIPLLIDLIKAAMEAE